MSVLVIDVGTSGLRAAIVRPDAAVDHVRYRAFAPDTPFAGLVEFDAGAMAKAVLEVAQEALDRGGPVEAVGITNQRASSVVWDRATGEPVGPALGWQDLRTIGTCLELAGKGLRLAPNQSATKVAWLLDTYDNGRERDLCFGTVDTWIAWTLSQGTLHVTDRSNAGVTGLLGADCSTWSDEVLDGSRDSGIHAPRPRRHDRRAGRGDGATGCTADRRPRRRPAGIARRAGVRGARAGQDHLRHRRDARRHPRSRPAGGRGARPPRHVPDRGLVP